MELGEVLERDDCLRGSVIQMLYLSKWRGLKIDTNRLEDSPSAYSYLTGILLQDYEHRAMLRKQQSDELERKELVELGANVGFMNAHEYKLEQFYGEARSSLDFDLSLMPEVRTENPYDEINRFHEK